MAMSHVSATSHVAEIVIANSWRHCQQPVVLPTAGDVANNWWYCQHLLASQVIWGSIYSPVVLIRNTSCFNPKGTTSHTHSSNIRLLDLLPASPHLLFIS